MRTLTLAGEALAVLVVLTGSIHAPYARVPDPPTDPGAAVLQVKEWRSLVGPSEQAEIPEVTILGGGRVIVPAGQDGALQRATEHTLTPDEYRYVYRLAHQAGLARNRHYSSPIEATDGSLLVVTLRSGGRTYTTTVTSPWAGEAGPRGRIVGFRRALNALVAAEATTPYRPSGVCRARHRWIRQPGGPGGAAVAGRNGAPAGRAHLRRHVHAADQRAPGGDRNRAVGIRPRDPLGDAPAAVAARTGLRRPRPGHTVSDGGQSNV
nr:hypothetical protein GCM10020092_101550 [Actinoplanes digitatis]